MSGSVVVMGEGPGDPSGAPSRAGVYVYFGAPGNLKCCSGDVVVVVVAVVVVRAAVMVMASTL